MNREDFIVDFGNRDGDPAEDQFVDVIILAMVFMKLTNKWTTFHGYYIM